MQDKRIVKVYSWSLEGSKSLNMVGEEWTRSGRESVQQLSGCLSSFGLFDESQIPPTNMCKKAPEFLAAAIGKTLGALNFFLPTFESLHSRRPKRF